jgi:hypothetical protein
LRLENRARRQTLNLKHCLRFRRKRINQLGTGRLGWSCWFQEYRWRRRGMYAQGKQGRPGSRRRRTWQWLQLPPGRSLRPSRHTPRTAWGKMLKHGPRSGIGSPSSVKKVAMDLSPLHASEASSFFNPRPWIDVNCEVVLTFVASVSFAFLQIHLLSC